MDPEIFHYSPKDRFLSFSSYFYATFMCMVRKTIFLFVGLIVLISIMFFKAIFEWLTTENSKPLFLTIVVTTSIFAILCGISFMKSVFWWDETLEFFFENEVVYFKYQNKVKRISSFSLLKTGVVVYFGQIKDPKGLEIIFISFASEDDRTEFVNFLNHKKLT